MAQILKQNIRDSILAGSLLEFAENGYSGASMVSIASRSGVSTGNIYRYFSNKNELFHVVVSKHLVNTLLKKLKQRVDAYPTGQLSQDIPDDSQYAILSEELLEYVIEHRLQVLILFEGSDGTDYENFRKKLVTKLAKSAAEALLISNKVLWDIYHNFFSAISSILRRNQKADSIHEAIKLLNIYHLGGLSILMIKHNKR